MIVKNCIVDVESFEKYEREEEEVKYPTHVDHLTLTKILYSA